MAAPPTSSFQWPSWAAFAGGSAALAAGQARGRAKGGRVRPELRAGPGPFGFFLRLKRTLGLAGGRKGAASGREAVSSRARGWRLVAGSGGPWPASGCLLGLLCGRECCWAACLRAGSTNEPVGRAGGRRAGRSCEPKVAAWPSACVPAAAASARSATCTCGLP